MKSIFGDTIPNAVINYEAHQGQREISDSIRDNFKSETPAAIIEIIASRGWGKTLYAVCELLMPFLEANPRAKVMWVAPNYMTALTPVDDVLRGFNEVTGEFYVPEYDENGNRVWEFVTTKSGPILKYWNGATVLFKSADSPESIVSRGFNLIIIDEAALIEERVFTQQILGTARKAGIKIFMITSPRGKKHFTYSYYLRGQDPQETQFLSFRQPYTKNPYFNPTLAKLIQEIPEWLRRQEYFAEFVDDGESVFHGLENVFYGDEISFPGNQQEWTSNLKGEAVNGSELKDFEDRRFIVAMDIAKTVYFTVITVMDLDTGELCHYSRFNKTDYKEVLRKAAHVCETYNNAELIFDATGVGSGLADFIESLGISTVPYVFSNESKVALINQLIVSIEYGELLLPNIVTMRNELAAFTYSLTRTGKISYAAPAGFHDDVIMSIAMANLYRKDNQSSGEIHVIDEIINFNLGRPAKQTWFEQLADDND